MGTEHWELKSNDNAAVELTRIDVVDHPQSKSCKKVILYESRASATGHRGRPKHDSQIHSILQQTGRMHAQASCTTIKQMTIFPAILLNCIAKVRRVHQQKL